MTNNNSIQRPTAPESEATCRAVAYVRVARAAHEDSRTIEHQRATCRQYAERHGLSLIREYADVGTPGRFAHQPELQRLLTELDEQRDAAVVIVTDYARLSRSLTEMCDICSRIRARGATIKIADTDQESKGGIHHDL